MLRHSQQALDELIGQSAAVAAYQIAEVYAWKGEKDKSFDWLKRAYAQRDEGLSNIKFDPVVYPLRGDPRYKALLLKMNLPE